MTPHSTPLFLEGRHGRLYGVHHAPGDASGQAGDLAHAVLLLPPLGQEYKRCHKSLQKLAQDLAAAGFHALRFDYAGSGDSEALASWSLDTWCDDGRDALAWLRTKSGATRFSAIGVRLGAAVALALDTPLEHLVLWDPVLDGAAYLESLEQLNQELLHRLRHAYRQGDTVRIPPGQLVGHPFPDRMRASLTTSVPAIPDPPPARHALLIDTSAGGTDRNADDATDRFSGHLAIEETFLQVEARCQWQSALEIENVIMGQPVTRQILQHFKQADAAHGNGA